MTDLLAFIPPLPLTHTPLKFHSEVHSLTNVTGLSLIFAFTIATAVISFPVAVLAGKCKLIIMSSPQGNIQWLRRVSESLGRQTVSASPAIVPSRCKEPQLQWTGKGLWLGYVLSSHLFSFHAPNKLPHQVSFRAHSGSCMLWLADWQLGLLGLTALFGNSSEQVAVRVGVKTGVNCWYPLARDGEIHGM